MTSEPSREYTYQEFSSFVRRFNQEALLAAVARRALVSVRELGRVHGHKTMKHGV